jgi:thiol-disulfide isomerase/thioredoxin
MFRFATIIGFVLMLVNFAGAGEWNVHGRVVDEAGKPVASASVASFWLGNGKRLHADGTPLVFGKQEDMPTYWQHIGEMEPVDSEHSAITDETGRFTFKLDEHKHLLLVMDRSRKHGALVSVPKGKEEQPLEVHLVPLIRVRGAFTCADTGQTPHWAIADVWLPDDPDRPLDNTRLVVCGSNEARFELSLPPGKYNFDMYGERSEKENENVRVQPTPTLELTADQQDVDLGTVRLAPYMLPRARVELAKANGVCFDYEKHYGEPPPEWHVSEARDIRKDAKISDFKGKWVLLTFWGLSCSVCLREELPKLMKFYEDHKAQRDQFEIISICIDYDGELKTLADVDRALEPIVKNVWHGKTLPFPVMLDPTFKTWETFGIDGLGTTILIDPEGKLVKGDETTLAEKLK